MTREKRGKSLYKGLRNSHERLTVRRYELDRSKALWGLIACGHSQFMGLAEVTDHIKPIREAAPGVKEEVESYEGIMDLAAKLKEKKKRVRSPKQTVLPDLKLLSRVDAVGQHVITTTHRDRVLAS